MRDADPARTAGVRPDEVVLGEIIGVFGIRGELRLMLHHRESGFLDRPRRVILLGPGGERRNVELSARSGAGKRVIGRLPGVERPEDAAALLGWMVVVARSDLPEPPPGEFYIHDLVGCRVVEEGGQELGSLADVVLGERDIWVIDTPEGEAWLLAVADTIRSVDLDARRVVVRPGAVEWG